MNTSPWKDAIPIPVFEENEAYVRLYWRAWELAYQHIKTLPGMPQTPYMDEGFIASDIWIWDTCFMTFFCKYAPSIFPGIESLRNFYEPLYDGKSLPSIHLPEDFPEWYDFKPGDDVPVAIHIYDNPPLFAWAECAYARMTGDKEHLRQLLLEKQYLQKHFAWMEHLTAPLFQQPPCRNVTCLIKRENGFLWEGGRSGMDNTPRGRVGQRAGSVERPNHPHMLWIDAIAQQALSAYCIAQCATWIDAPELAAEWTACFTRLKEKINRLYWDRQDAIYYDIHEDTLEFMKCITPASYWPMLCGIPSPDQAAGLVSHLENPGELGGEVPLITLSRRDPDFNAETGDYWRGSLWLPTAYMTLKGLENYGYLKLANQCGRKILEHMSQTYQNVEPHTIWECYAPNAPRPAKHGTQCVRQDFCGWSALGPISIFLEHVIGIHEINAFTHSVSWALPQTIRGAIGIRNLSFGDTHTDLVYAEGRLTSLSNRPYTLHIAGQDLTIPQGEACFTI